MCVAKCPKARDPDQFTDCMSHLVPGVQITRLFLGIISSLQMFSCSIFCTAHPLFSGVHVTAYSLIYLPNWPIFDTFGYFIQEDFFLGSLTPYWKIITGYEALHKLYLSKVVGVGLQMIAVCARVYVCIETIFMEDKAR